MPNTGQKFDIMIIGAGSWGTTLSVMLAEKGLHVYLWARNEQRAKQIQKMRENKRYTEELRLPSKVMAFNDLKEVKACPDLVIFAVPSHALREVVGHFYAYLDDLPKLKAALNVAKGFETGTNLRLSEVMADTLPARIKSKVAVLSGPNISSEIGKKLPSVSTVSSKNNHVLHWLQPLLSTDYFRVYTNADLVGVEIGGAVKNIIAIASGISDGLGYGTNTKASLVTRGLHEITKFGTSMGARMQTFAGISGMGDLITTCFSPHSRNRLFGQKVALGQKPDHVQQSMFMVAEGFNTTLAVYKLAQNMGVSMPITECIHDILYQQADPQNSVHRLMNRKFKSEI